MLAVIQYSFNAVMPIILLILLGVFARRKGFLEPPMLRKVNKFNFRFNFFAMMFMNLYEVESIRQMPVRMGVFMIASHCLLVLLGIILSGFLTGERFRRGVLVQALFRSNYAIIGIPVTVALVGDIGGQIASFLQLPVVLFYNMVSVLLLSYYSDYEAQYRLYGEGPLAESNQSREEQKKAMAQKSGVDFGKILKGLVTNPLIQGLLTGMVVLLIREVIPRGVDGELVFSMRNDLPWLYSSLQSLARMATPLALIVLGGQLEMKEIKGFSLLYVAVRLGLLVVGRPEIAVVVAIFGSPLAVSSIVMANEMGGDGHLDGQIVVWSSIFGMLSLFVLISILRSRGLL